MKILFAILIFQCGFSQTQNTHYTKIKKMIEDSDINGIKKELKDSIDLNSAPEGEGLLVNIAVNRKNYDAVRLLVKRGANINKMDGGFEGTSIMFAAYNNDFTMVDLLLNLGAILDQPDGAYGDPAINWAAYAGHTKMVDYLLKKGASPYLVGHGNTLDIAIRRGFEDMIHIVSDAMGLTQNLSVKANQLFTAVLNGDDTQVTSLINSGLNPNMLGKYNRPLIHLAALNGDLAMVKLLHQLGADIDRKDRIGFTALFHASLKNKVDVVRYLLENGADANHTSNSRSLNLTSFHLAAIGQSIGALELLSSFKVNQNQQCSTGATPLLWGLFESDQKNLDFAIRMIELGADPTIATPTGYTALRFAKGVNHEKLTKTIETWMQTHSTTKSE